MRKKINVYVYFDKTEETEKKKFEKQAQLFMLLAEMKRGRED